MNSHNFEGAGPDDGDAQEPQDIRDDGDAQEPQDIRDDGDAQEPQDIRDEEDAQDSGEEAQGARQLVPPDLLAKLNKPLFPPDLLAKLNKPLFPPDYLAKLNKPLFPPDHLAKLNKPLFPPDYLAMFGKRSLGNFIDERLRALPINLWPLKDELDDEVLRDYLQHEGIPICFVPRATVARRLLAANTSEERDSILEAHQDAIIEDCVEWLGELADEAYGSYAAFALEAVESMAASHWLSAQSLLTVTLDSLLGRLVIDGKPLHPDTVKVARRQGNKLKKAEPMDVFRDGYFGELVLMPIHNSHVQFFPEKLRPEEYESAVPKSYNRHASVHSAIPSQYSHANALRALLLVTSLLTYVFFKRPRLHKKSSTDS